MDQWLTTGYPDALPINQWYAVDPGDHNGVKSQGFDVDIQNGTIILIPVYNAVYPTGAAPANVTDYYIVGFAAIKLTNDNPWDGNAKQLKGTLVRYIASGLAGGPGTGNNFGVFVVGLDG
jgi:hypothetical protein